MVARLASDGDEAHVGLGSKRKSEVLSARSVMPPTETLVAPCYFVTTFTPFRPLASIAFCTSPFCFASSASVASRSCAA